MYSSAYSPLYHNRDVMRIFSYPVRITKVKAIALTGVGALALVIGLLCVVGWLLGMPYFASAAVVHPAITLGGALCSVFTGLAVMLFYAHGAKAQWLRIITAGIGFAISTFVLLQYMFTVQVTVAFAYNMGHTTAFGFAIINAAVLALKTERILWLRMAQYALHLVTFLSFIALGSYFIDRPVFHRLPVLAKMSLPAAWVLCSTSVALSFVEARRGITGFFTGNGIGEQMARRLLPTMVLMILLLATIRMWMHEQHMVSVETGGALFTLAFMVACVFLIGLTADWLNSIDAQRRLAETELAEVNMNRRLRELEVKNKEMEQFAFVASHDLQEPLRTITGFATLLKKRYTGRLDPDADAYLNYMEQSSTRMMELIKGLLYYSRIGKERNLETVYCNAVLDNVLNDLQARIKEVGATIQCDELPVIQGYRVEIGLLLQNLISNAIKFKRQGVPPVINITAQRQDGKWLFKVQDNGIGIEEKDRENIFIIFKRLNNRGDFEGEGIGLAHCKKIAELHQGNIWVESEYGKGSTFCFTLCAS